MSAADAGRGWRFMAVGAANTAIDFGVLLTLTAAGTPPLVANIASTSVALGFSFVANRRFTFRASGDPRRQLAWFLIVTLTGLWVLQSLVIQASLAALSGLGLAAALKIALAKGIATAASLTWNYLLYSRLVFRDRADDGTSRSGVRAEER